MPRLTTLLLCLAFASPVLAQTFDVVSVKPHPPESGAARFNSGIVERPDGGITMTNVTVPQIIGRAYAIAPVNMVGLPDWARNERHDFSATASIERPTTADRAAMLRAALADRFKLSVHVEPRAQDTYALVLARKDGALGAGLTRIDTDCDTVMAERATVTPQPGQFPDSTLPPCTLRSMDARTRGRLGGGGAGGGGLLEGEGTMAMLANALRLGAGRVVVDKTGLAGSYRVRMLYDQDAARRRPDALAPDDAGPSVFDALPEQLGLRLESSKTMVDTLVIDHIERPTEN
jgi:uncharacterized protein (TIGR03435 family)